MQHFLPHIFSETEADPQTKIFSHHWGVRPHPVAGLNLANPPPPANRTLVQSHKLFWTSERVSNWDQTSLHSTTNTDKQTNSKHAT